MAARRPFWKWHRWKWIGFCLWPPSTCIWNLKLKFQSKLDLCSGNHVVYRQTDRRTDGRTDKVNPVYPPPTSLGGGIKTNIQSVIQEMYPHESVDHHREHRHRNRYIHHFYLGPISKYWEISYRCIARHYPEMSWLPLRSLRVWYSILTPW